MKYIFAFILCFFLNFYLILSAVKLKLIKTNCANHTINHKFSNSVDYKYLSRHANLWEMCAVIYIWQLGNFENI